MNKIKIRICCEPCENSSSGKLYYFEVLEKIWIFHKWVKAGVLDSSLCGFTKEELVEKITNSKRMSNLCEIVNPNVVHERKPCYPVRENRWHINCKNYR